MKDKQKSVCISDSMSPQRESGNTPGSVKISWWKRSCSCVGCDAAVLALIPSDKLGKSHPCSFQRHLIHRDPNSSNPNFDGSLQTILDYPRLWLWPMEMIPG